MRKKTKLLIFLSAILVISIAVTGCFAGDKDGEEATGEEDNPQIEEDQDDLEEEPLESDEDVVLTELPPFNLKDLEGNDVSSDIFDDYEMTIVPMWQSSCGPCIGELDALNTIYDEYKDQEVNVLGISLDNVEEMGDDGVQTVKETLGLNYTNVIAGDYVMELLDFVEGTPTAYVIGEGGEILLGPKVGSNGKEQDIEDFRNMIIDIKER